MPVARVARRARGRVPVLIGSTLAGVLVAALGTLAVPRWLHPTLHDRFARVAPERSIQPRTSIPVRYRECRLASTDSVVPGATCAGSSRDGGGEAMEAIAAETFALLEAEPDADAMHTGGLLYLYQDTPQTDQAITLLDSALRLTQDSAAVMVDLSAAHLVRAGQQQSWTDLDHALEWAQRAQALEPGNKAAAFNAALALDRMTAERGAAAAWQAYLSAARRPGVQAYLRTDGEARWRAEAERSLRKLQAHAPAARPGERSSDGEVAAFAAAHPQEAREWGWNVLLPGWGDATLRGEWAVARAALHRAGVVAAALARKGSDATLRDEVARLGAITDGGRVRDAARSHHLYGRLIEARAKQSAAAAVLLDSLRAVPLGASQAVWVQILGVAAAIEGGQLDQAERLLNGLETRIEAPKNPAAAGRRAWMRATLQVRRGAYEEGPRMYLQAESAFARAGETRNQGMVQSFISDAQRTGGQRGEADRWLLRAANTMRPFGPSIQRHDMFRQAAITAGHDGLFHAMRLLADEDVAVAMDVGNPFYVAEARLNRAGLLAIEGNRAAAIRDLARAEPVMRDLDPNARGFLATARDYVRALVLVSPAPDSALVLADRLVNDRSRALWPMRGFSIRARALVALHDTAGAQAALDRVFDYLDRARDEYGGGAADRDLVEGDVRIAVHGLVEALARAGRTRDALAYLERGNAATSAIRLADVRIPDTIPAGRAVIRTLIASDTLLTWTLADDRIWLDRTPVDRNRLLAKVQTAETWLAQSWNADTMLADLHATLIGPVAARLKPGTELVFVTDDDLEGLPFAALLGPRGKPLMMDHPVSRAPSVAAAAARRGTVAGTAAFLAPAYDPRRSGGLPALVHARQEVDLAAAGYPLGRPLPPATDAAALRRSLPSVVLFHFAGHAVTDVANPERSYLALGTGARDEGLTAAEIEGLRLDNVRLVVLSACSSLGGSGGSSGFTGLSGAFLGGGAHGVVGSLWRVNDQAAMRLMQRFHHHYRELGDPARALQQAQIDLWDESEPSLRSPAGWAAFQYVGQ